MYFVISWQTHYFATWPRCCFDESQCQGCVNMTPCQQAWQRHILRWCFCVFVSVFLCFCDGAVVVAWLCFRGGVFVFLWWCVCVFAVV